MKHGGPPAGHGSPLRLIRGQEADYLGYHPGSGGAGSRARFPSRVHQQQVISSRMLLTHVLKCPDGRSSYLHNWREDASSRACGADMVTVVMKVMRSRGLSVSCCGEISVMWAGSGLLRCPPAAPVTVSLTDESCGGKSAPRKWITAVWRYNEAQSFRI